MTTTLKYESEDLDPGAISTLLDESEAGQGSQLVTVFECQGKTYTVTTTQNPGESNADFAQRHKDRVAQAKADAGC